MKTKFPAYHRVNKEDLLERFDECVFVFDACALLDIYRMKKEVTENVFKVMEHLNKQICIPYHVAEEYFDNIHGVLISQIESIKSSRTDFNKFIQTLEAKRSQPYISKQSGALLNKLKKQVDNDFKQQEDYLKDQLVRGEYQNRMSDLLDGKVLEPFNHDELVDIEKEGEKRIASRIPPGYKDANKSSNRYGDIIIWKEILRFAKESGKSIVIVSSEIKEDWVIRELGYTICLRYELMKEFYDTIGNNGQLLHFLSLDRFLELAREKNEQVVSEATVNEVKDYVMQPFDNLYDRLFKSAVGLPDVLTNPAFFKSRMDSLRLLQEQLDSKNSPGYREAVEAMNKALIEVQKAKRIERTKDFSEDKEIGDTENDSSKENDSE